MSFMFLSYAREDEPRVATLLEALRAEGLSIWWDRDIPAEAPWEQVIEEKLHSAALVLTCWTASSVNSQFVKAEARFAQQAGKLVQVFLEKTNAPIFLSYAERQGFELICWNGRRADDAFRRLVDFCKGTFHPPHLISTRQTKIHALVERVRLLHAALVQTLVAFRNESGLYTSYSVNERAPSFTVSAIATLALEESDVEEARSVVPDLCALIYSGREKWWSRNAGAWRAQVGPRGCEWRCG